MTVPEPRFVGGGCASLPTFSLPRALRGLERGKLYLVASLRYCRSTVSDFGRRKQSFFLVWLTVLLLIGGSAAAAARRKNSETPAYRTMAEVLAHLGKPDAIAYAELREEKWAAEKPGIALLYGKQKQRTFAILPNGEVTTRPVPLYPPNDRDNPGVLSSNRFAPTGRQRESVAEVCARLGNPDAVSAVSRDHQRHVPRLAVQLTFTSQKERYQVSHDGYVLDRISLSDVPEDVETVVEMCKRFGKPDRMARRGDFQVMFERTELPQQSVVFIYNRFDNQRLFFTVDGKLFAPVPRKTAFLGPEWFPPPPRDEARRTIADIINEHGQPDRLETAIHRPPIDGGAAMGTIMVSYERPKKRWYFDPVGYLLDCEPGPCP